MALSFAVSISSIVSPPNPNPSPRRRSFLTPNPSFSRCSAAAVRCSAAGDAGGGVAADSVVPSVIVRSAYIRIFDTTLRDGEQSPGATMTSNEKLAIARHLSRLGVDIIEAGFPDSSPDDLDVVRLIAIEVENEPSDGGHVPVICGLLSSMIQNATNPACISSCISKSHQYSSPLRAAQRAQHKFDAATARPPLHLRQHEWCNLDLKLAKAKPLMPLPTTSPPETTLSP